MMDWRRQGAGFFSQELKELDAPAITYTGIVTTSTHSACQKHCVMTKPNGSSFFPPKNKNP
jgi:hypothetical protein